MTIQELSVPKAGQPRLQETCPTRPLSCSRSGSTPRLHTTVITMMVMTVMVMWQW